MATRKLGIKMDRVKESRLFHRVLNERIRHLRAHLKKDSTNKFLKVRLKEVQKLFSDTLKVNMALEEKNNEKNN